MKECRNLGNSRNDRLLKEEQRRRVEERKQETTGRNEWEEPEWEKKQCDSSAAVIIRQKP